VEKKERGTRLGNDGEKGGGNLDIQPGGLNTRAPPPIADLSRLSQRPLTSPDLLPFLPFLCPRSLSYRHTFSKIGSRSALRDDNADSPRSARERERYCMSQNGIPPGAYPSLKSPNSGHLGSSDADLGRKTERSLFTLGSFIYTCAYYKL